MQPPYFCNVKIANTTQCRNLDENLPNELGRKPEIKVRMRHIDRKRNCHFSPIPCTRQ